MASNGIDGEHEGSLTTRALSTAFCLMRGGFHLGVGLTALVVEAIQSVVAEAIKRGEAIEQHGRERVVAFEREHVVRMKDYLKRSNGDKDDVSVEAKVEQALATFDDPTRDDIREPHMHLSALGDKINRLQSV